MSPDTMTYQAFTRNNIDKLPQYQALPEELQSDIQVTSAVLPFRVNRYVVESLINWNDIPDDPIYQLTFSQKGMLTAEDYNTIANLIRRDVPATEITAAANRIRLRLNPHPAGQLEHNVPSMNGERLAGIQHKYAETVLFFPSAGQTCHAYCSYCFRWAQFIGNQDLKFAARQADQLGDYLRGHPRVTDVLFTGGDPMVMKTHMLERYITPLLDPALAHIRTIRIGTKAVAYWPYRFAGDADADDLLRLFDRIISSGKHVAIMGHYSHPVELSTPIAQQAIRRLRDVGCEIRMQAPLIRRVNDDSDIWAALWRDGVRLGLIPYYMFVSRDTGAKQYYNIPLDRALVIFQGAYRQLSGLGRTVRGPVMSCMPGKVMLHGVTSVNGQRAFVLSFIQGREARWVGRPFFARYDPAASWFTDLKPLPDQSRFFFETDMSAFRRSPYTPTHPPVRQTGLSTPIN
jgi:KamA family protein